MSPSMRLQEQGCPPSLTTPSPSMTQHRGTSLARLPPPPKSNLVTGPDATVQTELPRLFCWYISNKSDGALSPEQGGCFGSALNCMKLLHKLCQASTEREGEREREAGREERREEKREGGREKGY